MASVPLSRNPFNLTERVTLHCYSISAAQVIHVIYAEGDINDDWDQEHFSFIFIQDVVLQLCQMGKICFTRSLKLKTWKCSCSDWFETVKVM